MRQTIFVVSGDARLRAGLVEGLGRRGFDVQATRGEALAGVSSPELVVIDVVGDLHPVRELRAAHPAARILVLVPCATARTVFAALRLGAVHCIGRTADADRLLQAFAEADRPIDTMLSLDESFPTLDEARAGHIGMALDLARGNISRAARLLGIHRQSLQRILRQTRHPAQSGAEGSAA